MAQIRGDLIGVVWVEADGHAIALKAGDPVPEGVTLGDHVLDQAADDDPDEAFIPLAKPQLPEGDPSEAWKVDELKAFAEQRNIDLGEATKKADILAVILAAAA